MSKAIVVRKSSGKTLASPVRERGVPGREIVPASSRALGPTARESKKAANLNVVNAPGRSESGGQTVTGTTRQTGSGQIWAANNGVTLRGLVKAVDAIRVATQLGVAPSAMEEALRGRVLTMGNKRKKQALAGGGYIQRRVGGTGYGGAHNRGFLKGRGKKKGGPSYGGTPGNPYDYVSKKRSTVGDAPTVSTQGKRMALEDTKGGKQLALEDTKGGKQLALEDTKGGKQLALTNGEGKNQLAVVPKKGDLALAPAPRGPAPRGPALMDNPGAAEDVASYVPKINTLINAAKTAYAVGENVGVSQAKEKWRAKDKALDDSYEAGKRLKLGDIVSAVKRRDFSAAVNLVFTSPEKWASEVERRKAEKFLTRFGESL